MPLEVGIGILVSPVSAPAACTDSPPSGADSLSWTAPDSAPTLTGNMTSSVTNGLSQVGGQKDAEMLTMAGLCHPPALLLSSFQLLSLKCRKHQLD